jgi:hypothetical protein
MTADALLSRLDGVKQTGPGRWIARCPAHDDTHPSLNIRETDDGRVLIHDFGGCSVEEVLNAIGMTFDDLFPDRVVDHRVRPGRRTFYDSDILHCLTSDALVIASSGVSMLNGTFQESDRERLIEGVSHFLAWKTA